MSLAEDQHPVGDLGPHCQHWPPSPCARLSRARTTTGPPPHPAAIGRQRTCPPAGLAARRGGRPGMVPTFTTESIDEGGARLDPDSIATPTPQFFDVASPPDRQTGFGVDPPRRAGTQRRGSSVAAMVGSATLGFSRELRTRPIRNRPRTSRWGQVEHRPVATSSTYVEPPQRAHSSSKSAGRMLGCPEVVAGEYRRIGAHAVSGGATSTGDSGQACTVGPTTTHSGTCGAPVARKRARRVREAARGNPPVETPAGRPGSTSRMPRPLGRTSGVHTTCNLHAEAHTVPRLPGAHRAQ